MSNELRVRDAGESEVDQIAQIWYNGWLDAHAELMPPELSRFRTLESFRERTRAALVRTRVIGPLGAPLGFSMLKGDELDQLFVAAAARGSGIAAELTDDAEARLAQSGVETAWLACAIGNNRAARFYEKRGWHRAGIMVHHAEIPNGTFSIEVWRYEKLLKGAA